MSHDISEALGGDFDAESIPIPSYEPIPPGWYAAEIDKAEVRDKKPERVNTSSWNWLSSTKPTKAAASSRRSTFPTRTSRRSR